jgi:hypothetical protein
LWQPIIYNQHFGNAKMAKSAFLDQNFAKIGKSKLKGSFMSRFTLNN